MDYIDIIDGHAHGQPYPQPAHMAVAAADGSTAIVGSAHWTPADFAVFGKVPVAAVAYDTAAMEINGYTYDAAAGVARAVLAPLPPETIRAAALDALRSVRDTRLATALAILDRHRNQVDFGLPATLTDAQATAWAVYAQALRDLPEHTADPANPEWPAAPTGEAV